MSRLMWCWQPPGKLMPDCWACQPLTGSGATFDCVRSASPNSVDLTNSKVDCNRWAGSGSCSNGAWCRPDWLDPRVANRPRLVLLSNATTRLLVSSDNQANLSDQFWSRFWSRLDARMLVYCCQGDYRSGTGSYKPPRAKAFKPIELKQKLTCLWLPSWNCE